jgi:hypothetical protein
MNLSHPPNPVLASKLGGCHVAEQIVQQRLEVEPAIAAVGERAELLAGVLSELEGLMGAVAQGFEVSRASQRFCVRTYAKAMGTKGLRSSEPCRRGREGSDCSWAQRVAAIG